MGPVERVFGLVLVVTLFAFGAYFAIKNDVMSNMRGGASSPAQTASTYKLTDRQLSSPCACFETAFKSAARTGVTSPQYRSGFLRCRNLHGSEGGRLWTAGWEARLQGLGGRKGGCKAFLGSQA
ncbi:MAG: hypothetical protein AAGL49_13890 [Pseudomonadota bacterium]